MASFYNIKHGLDFSFVTMPDVAMDLLRIKFIRATKVHGATNPQD
jgi:hypothetical protein